MINTVKYYWNHKCLLLMLIIPFTFFLVFKYLPMGGLVIAFKDFSMKSGIIGSHWNGLDNFHRLFINSSFIKALRNTVVISFLKLSIGFCCPILLALLINEVRLNMYKRFVQSISFIPHFFSWVTLSGIFLMIFSTDGPLNVLAVNIYGKPISFMTTDYWFIAILIGTAIWQEVGYGSIIYLAALSGISPQLYEAATVDGANRWQQTWNITLPCLVPTIVTMLILAVGGFLNAGFDQIFNMYNSSVYDVADIIDTYVLRRLETMDYALGTAAGLFKSFVGMILVLLVNSLSRRISRGEQGIW
ncbi:ABC transporter permease subunit [Lentisphaerota bacterium ZTH]|nr:sugar ABC transporter permease [Lentisphaerota bacterium]WET05751.1 ABC transporter permease subunit [Lentisphaerota bacterium ZTH]